MLASRMRFGVTILVACLEFAGCSESVRPEGTLPPGSSDSSIVVLDAQPGDAETEPSYDRFDLLARGAGGVLIGRVDAIRTDATVVRSSVGGYDWLIYYDEVDMVVEYGVGSTVPPRATVLGIPARCEATLQGVPQPDARLSICSPREPGSSVRVPERIMAFVGGRGISQPAQLAFIARIDGRGFVDLSVFGLPPQTVDMAWQRVELARSR